MLLAGEEWDLNLASKWPHLFRAVNVGPRDESDFLDGPKLNDFQIYIKILQKLYKFD